MLAAGGLMVSAGLAVAAGLVVSAGDCAGFSSAAWSGAASRIRNVQNGQRARLASMATSWVWAEIQTIVGERQTPAYQQARAGEALLPLIRNSIRASAPRQAGRRRPRSYRHPCRDCALAAPPRGNPPQAGYAVHLVPSSEGLPIESVSFENIRIEGENAADIFAPRAGTRAAPSQFNGHVRRAPVRPRRTTRGCPGRPEPPEPQWSSAKTGVFWCVSRGPYVCLENTSVDVTDAFKGNAPSSVVKRKPNRVCHRFDCAPR